MFGRGAKKRRERWKAAQDPESPAVQFVEALAAGSALVLDGDAVASYGWPHLDISAQRSNLVGYCASLAEAQEMDAARVWVLFDRMTQEAAPSSRRLTVQVADDRTAAAERALELIGELSPSVVVWADDPNAASLRAAGASLVATDVLLDAFLDL